MITKILRRGKFLIFLYSNNYSLLLHLGMTGYFRLSKTYEKIKNMITYDLILMIGY